MTPLRIQKSPTRFSIHLVPGAAQDSISNIEDSALRNTALVANGNFAGHYEIALYGSLAAFARHLGLQDAATLLEQTLNEEKKVFEKSSIRRARPVLAAQSRRCPTALATG
jgi:ferritin-like metal-binding protein YciE